MNRTAFTSDRYHLAADVARLREALADYEASPATVVGAEASAHAVGRLAGAVHVLLIDLDVSADD